MEREKSSLDNGGKEIREQKAVSKPVVKGKVKERKKSFGERLFEMFLPGNPKDIAVRVLEENLVPGIKSALQNTIEDSIDSMLYDNAPGSRRRPRRRDDRPSYSSYYEERRSGPRGSRASYEERGTLLRARGVVDELIFEFRQDAEEVLRRMQDQIREYGCASVMDLYGFCDKHCDYQKDKWGWYSDLDDARIRKVSSGWILELREPVIIK